MKPPAYPIASVDRALRLLLMLRQRPRLRLLEVSGELGVAPSTAHRLLGMLAYHGFVRQEPGRRDYVVGPALAELGRAVPTLDDVRAVVRPVMARLAAASGETVHFSALEARQVRYLEAVESDQVLRVASRAGRTLPANATAVGKALMSELSPAQVEERFGSQPLEAATDRSITDLGLLQRELERVRRRGYAINIEESEAGVASLALPVHDPQGSVVGALSLAGPLGRMQGERRDRRLFELRGAVAEVEAALRGRTGMG